MVQTPPGCHIPGTGCATITDIDNAAVRIDSTRIQTQPVQWLDLGKLAYFMHGLVYVLSSPLRMDRARNKLPLTSILTLIVTIRADAEYLCQIS